MSKAESKENSPSTEQEVEEKIRAAVRSVMRDWISLSAPLSVDALPESEQHGGGLRYRVRGSESYEELQEQVIQFSGRVWQLKDGLIKWFESKPGMTLAVNTQVFTTTGKYAKEFVEEYAKLCLPLLLCADLYNSFKHYVDCNRSKYSPFLNGVSFYGDDGRPLSIGFGYDGTRRYSDILLTEPQVVRFEARMHSKSHSVDFGNAIVVIGNAFRHWVQLICTVGVFSSNDAINSVLMEDLQDVMSTINRSSPFKMTESVICFDELSEEDKRLVLHDPPAFFNKKSRADTQGDPG